MQSTFLKYSLVLSFSVLLLSCKSSNMGRMTNGEDGKITGGTTKLKCTYPTKRYANGLDVKVKTSVDSLLTVPFGQIDAALSKTVVRLADYTSEGLDMDLFLFRICEMSNNRGLSAVQTQELLYKAMERWNTSEEIKKKLSTSN